MKVCIKCEGVGKYSIGTDNPKQYNCLDCYGTGSLDDVDYLAIFSIIKGRKGLKTSKPTIKKDYNLMSASERVLENRAQYVWRWTRFHAGIDVTLPFTFFVDKVEQKNLDLFAEYLAFKLYGLRRSAGAVRWANALGGSVSTEGLPDTAQNGGRAVMGELCDQDLINEYVSLGLIR